MIREEDVSNQISASWKMMGFGQDLFNKADGVHSHIPVAVIMEFVVRRESN